MAAKARASVGAKKAKDEGNVARASTNGNEEETKPLPFSLRIVIIILTSYVAEKIWSNRTIVSQGWYSDKQTPMQQNMIVVFEYIVAMGMLFFMGILISSATVWIQKKLGL